MTAVGGVLPSDIFLDGEKARNRAQEGDEVGHHSVEFAFVFLCGNCIYG